MGARLMVGLLGERAEADGGVHIGPEGLDALNRDLERSGIPGQDEPRDPVSWSTTLKGSRPIALLRRLAAHVDAGSALPPPGSPEAANDRVVKAYRDDAAGAPSGMVGTLLKGRLEFDRGFDHLVLPQGDLWIAVPHDFEHPIAASDEVPGAWISSVPRLAKECERLASELGIPSHLDAPAIHVTSSESSSAPAERWQRYAKETAACVALIEGCNRSLSTGAALVAAVSPDEANPAGRPA